MVIFSFRVCKSTIIYLLNELWTALGVWRRIFIFHTWKLTNECLFFNKLVNFQHPRPPLLFSICLRLTMGSLKSFVLHFDWKATKFWSPSWYFGLLKNFPSDCIACVNRVWGFSKFSWLLLFAHLAQIRNITATLSTMFFGVFLIIELTDLATTGPRWESSPNTCLFTNQVL